MHPLFRYLLVILLGLALSGCATQALHSGKTEGHEKIRSFLITQDASTLVVAGEQHHFIFPLQEPLRSVLQWRGRSKLNPSFGTFTVDKGQGISGSYTLTAEVAKLGAQEQQFLTQQGFARDTGGTTLSYSADIRGTRYLAGDVKVPQTAHFKQPYDLTIIAPDGAADTAVKLALTPLALAADGVTAVLGGIVVLPFAMYISLLMP